MTRRPLFLGLLVGLCGVALAWLTAPPAVAQLGGLGAGGLGGGGLSDGDFGGAFGAPVPSLGGEQIIQGGGFESGIPSFFVLIAPDKTRAWAYSTAKGEWKPAPLDDKPETTFVPIVGSKVATIAEGNKVHGFSSLKGEWNTLELPDGTVIGDPQPVVDHDYVQVRTPASMSIFSATTGNWSTVKFAKE